MVPPRRQGTPTRLRNWASSSPKKPQAATTSTTPGVTLEGPSVYGPSCTDSTISAVAAAAYRPSRLAGRSSRPPATIGRTSAAGENHTEFASVAAAISGNGQEQAGQGDPVRAVAAEVVHGGFCARRRGPGATASSTGP